MKKILVHSPYWKTGGGGERYSLTVAESLQNIADVFVTMKNKKLLINLEEHLGLDLRKVRIFDREVNAGNLVGMSGVFWVSDGSIPLLPVLRRVIHFQAPFKGVGGYSWKNKFKLFGTKVVCNSNYTKKYIDGEFGIKSRVIYPPVEAGGGGRFKKQNLIITVGRFSTSSQNKRQDILVKSFKKMVDAGLKNWRLVVAGIAENEESRIMVSALRTMSKGYPIAIKIDLTHRKIMDLYRQTAIYWHAAGYGMDLNKYPEKAEHFGISTVEAMGSGAVPIVFGAGGQPEIVEEGRSGLLWDTPEDLINKTLNLIGDSNQGKILSEGAVKRSCFFSKEIFSGKIRNLFR